jgi:hypothetical protein
VITPSPLPRTIDRRRSVRQQQLVIRAEGVTEAFMPSAVDHLERAVHERWALGMIGKLDRKIRGSGLSELDPFWIRWGFFLERIELERESMRGREMTISLDEIEVKS